MKFIKTFKLFESPDGTCVYTHPKDIDAITFLIYNDKLYVSDDQYHIDIADEIVNKMEKGKIDDVDAPIRLLEDCYYQGRIWTDSKVISFWDYPKTKNDLFDFLKKLEKKIHKKIIDNGYKIEIIDFNDDLKDIIINEFKRNKIYIKPEEIDYKNVNIIGREIFYKHKGIEEYITDTANDKLETIIPLEEYKGSLNVPNELKNIHLMNSKDKQKLKKNTNFGKGFGADKTAWDSPNNIQNRQKIYSESMKHLKLFETKVLDDILDKLSDTGYDSLTDLEKDYLNNYDENSSKTRDYEKKINSPTSYKYENDDTEDIDELEPPTEKSDNIYEDMWNKLAEPDFESFIKEFSLPDELIKYSWRDVPPQFKVKFKKFIDNNY